MPSDELNALLERQRGLLRRASVDRRNPMRTPVVCTCDQDGAHGRVMVLRDFHHDTLVFYTDARTAKLSQLAAPAEVVFWNRTQRIQLRLRGPARVVREGSAWEQARAALIESPGEGRDYRTRAAPGTALDEEQLELVDTLHFAILEVRAHQLEYLELKREGHRRARFDLENSTSHWLVP